MRKALQDIITPEGVCFGCGPANPDGLQIKSYLDDDGVHVVCDITPDNRFCGMPDIVYGGYLAMLADCHSGWTAKVAFLRADGASLDCRQPINAATARLTMHYRKPTPMGVPLHLKARPDGPASRRVSITCEMYAAGQLTVVAESVFVRVDHEELRQTAYRKSGRVAP